MSFSDNILNVFYTLDQVRFKRYQKHPNLISTNTYFHWFRLERQQKLTKLPKYHSFDQHPSAQNPIEKWDGSLSACTNVGPPKMRRSFSRHADAIVARIQFSQRNTVKRLNRVWNIDFRTHKVRISNSFGMPYNTGLVPQHTSFDLCTHSAAVFLIFCFRL